MSLSTATGEIVAAVVGSGVSGCVAAGLAWWQRRSPARLKRVKDAWQAQAKELLGELRNKHAADESYLKGQLDAKDVALAYKDAEIARLNRLLTRRGAHD